MVDYGNAQLVETRALAEATSKNRAVLDMTELFDHAVTDEAARFARVLAGNFSGSFSLDAGRTVDVGGKPAPVLKIGDTPINMDFTIPDRFTAQTDATATVFVASGEDFIRISTSVKKENGERAVGTLLDRSHAGYKALLAGQPYIGFAQLFGHQYMTQYNPIKDTEGNVIAVLYVGINISHRRAFGIGAKVGVLAFGVVATVFGLFILTLGSAMTSLAVALHAAPAQQMAQQMAQLQTRYAGFALIAVLAAVGMLYLVLQRMVTQPLQHAMIAAQQLAKGDLTTQVHVGRRDEIGMLMQA
ncbi:MAG: Cache 3/Cache 2 fusion domain-containing protein, partial [Herminiimonas sp.]|nr:Cache 3/Cache 2 fusion domain-containing protein [Herminiimonas sp.]